jgi:hypothetical protein
MTTMVEKYIAMKRALQYGTVAEYNKACDDLFQACQTADLNNFPAPSITPPEYAERLAAVTQEQILEAKQDERKFSHE